MQRPYAAVVHACVSHVWRARFHVDYLHQAIYRADRDVCSAKRPGDCSHDGAELEAADRGLVVISRRGAGRMSSSTTASLSPWGDQSSRVE